MWFIGLEQIVSNRHILSAIISGSRVLTPGRKSESIFRNTFKRLSVFTVHIIRETWKNNHSFSTRAKETHETSSKYSNLSKIPFHCSSLLGTPFSLPPLILPQAEGRCLVALKNSGLVRTPFPSKSICRKNCFLTGAVDLEKSKAWKCGDMMQTSRTSKRADAFKFSFGILVPSIHKQSLRY